MTKACLRPKPEADLSKLKKLGQPDQTGESQGEKSTASYYGSNNNLQNEGDKIRKNLSNHSMTTLSEKNEYLEAGGSPSPLKLQKNKNEK